MSAPPPRKRGLSGSGSGRDYPNKKSRQESTMNESSEEENTQTDVGNLTSKYDGVYWFEQTQTWVAQVQHKKNAYYIGSFSSELEAAIAVNEKCKELGIKIRNPEVENNATIRVTTKKDTTSRTSRYVGVSWGKREGKWLARFTHKGKPHFVGYFTDEQEAAAAINERCNYLNIPIKNRGIEIARTSKSITKTSSKYSSIHWHPSSKKWIAELNHLGQKINLGSFHSEIDAAISVNNKCRDLNIPLQNPELARMEVSPRMSGNKTSRYKHVNWDRPSKKWRAQMSINGVQTYIGLFENERDAAFAVNQKCLEMGMPLRNPDLEHDEDEESASASTRLSDLTAVHWIPNRKQWEAKFVHENRSVNLGFFNSAEEAGDAVNRKCNELGIPPKNPMLRNAYTTERRTVNDNLKIRRKVDDEFTYQDYKPKAAPYKKSKYACVHWNSETFKWVGQFKYFGKLLDCGQWPTEVEAATAVNKKCKDLDIPFKNPSIGLGDQAEDMKISHYDGVIWDPETHQWKAKFEYRGLIIFVGIFKTAYQAALEINVKCKELGIPLLNKLIPPQPQVLSNDHNSASGTNSNGGIYENGYDNGNGYYDNGNGYDNGHGLNGFDTSNGNGINGTDTNGNGHGSNGRDGTDSNGLNGYNGFTDHNGLNGYDNGNGLNGHSNGHNGYDEHSNNNHHHHHHDEHTNSSDLNGYDNGNGLSNGYDNGNGMSNSTDHNHNGKSDNNKKDNLIPGDSIFTSSYGPDDIPTNVSPDDYENDDEEEVADDENDDEDEEEELAEDWEEEFELLKMQLLNRNRILHEQSLQLQEKDNLIKHNENAIQEAAEIIESQKAELAEQDQAINRLQN